MLAKMLGESRRRALTNNDLLIAGVLTAVPLLLIARQPDLGTAVTLLPILLVVAYVAGMPMQYLGALALVAVARRAGRLPVRPAGLPARAHLHLPRSGAGRPWRRLSADSGPHHRRLGRRVGQGLHAGHAGPAALPARRAQRLHLLGARRGAGVRRRARRPRALPVRDHARARCGPAGQGPARRLSGPGRAGRRSRSRSSTTSPCRRVWRRSRDSRCRS